MDVETTDAIESVRREVHGCRDDIRIVSEGLAALTQKLDARRR